MRESFESIVKLSRITDTGLCNLDKALFHYYSPNGLRAQKERLNKIISHHVREGKLNTGWILAYGTAFNYSISRLHALTLKKRVAGSLLYAVLESIRFDIKTATERLREEGIEV